VAVIALAGTAAGCGDRGANDDAVRVEVGDDASSAGAALVRASDTTGAVETGRMNVTYRMQGSEYGEVVDATFTAAGSFADFGRQAELTLDMSDLARQMGQPAGSAPSSMVMHEIVDGTTIYVKVDSDEAVPGLGDGWMKMDIAALGESGDSPLGGASGLGGGPAGMLESLKGAGASVEETGTDTIDGVPVTVYSGTIDPDAAVQAASPDKVDEVRGALEESGMMASMPFTAYVDRDGLVRRLEMQVKMGVDDTSMQMSMTVDFSDFDAPITITPPPADEVTDMSDLSSFIGAGGLQHA
jgi:hypothetical protein